MILFVIPLDSVTLPMPQNLVVLKMGQSGARDSRGGVAGCSIGLRRPPRVPIVAPCPLIQTTFCQGRLKFCNAKFVTTNGG